MNYCRFYYKGKEYYGREENKILIPFNKGYFDSTEELSGIEKLAVKILAPCRPSKIVAVGVNFYSHAEEMSLRNEIKTEPLIFLKPSTAVSGHGDYIEYPAISNRLDYEAEIAVVIKKVCKKYQKKMQRNTFWVLPAVTM